MASAMPLEKSVLEDSPEVKDIVGRLVYRGNRISAAARFAADVVTSNIRAVRKPSPDYEKSRRWYDPLAIPIAEPLKYPMCFSTYVSGFFYAVLALQYSPKEKGYVFNPNPEDRLSVVG